MNIAIYPPNDFQAEFIKLLPQHNFQYKGCDHTTDIIYSGSISQLPPAIQAKAQFNKPLICWVWDIPFNWREWCEDGTAIQANQGRDSQIAQQIHWLNTYCDKVISGSKYTQRVLKELYGIDSDQMYFYIETETLDKASSPPAGKYTLQVSRFAHNKKFEHSIRACAKTGHEFIGVGTGEPYMNNLQVLANSLNAKSQFFHGPTREDVASLIKGAQVVVSPSLNEGWGMTPVEAIHCGTPILLSDLDVFKEQYEDDAFYHKRNDADDMAVKLEILYKDKNLQNSIVEKCKLRIQDFTIDKFAKRWNSWITQ